MAPNGRFFLGTTRLTTPAPGPFPLPGNGLIILVDSFRNL